jgi:hypothetical protein
MPSPPPDPRTVELFVVRVQEERTEALTEQAGREYVSPPQERTHALGLVELMLGREVAVNGERECCWRQPIAGGQRSVTLQRVDQ